MKTAIVLSILLFSGCYEKSDAVDQVRNLARPNPIRCAQTSGGGDGSYKTFTCTDGGGLVWACDEDGCVNTGHVSAGAEVPL